MTKYLSYKGGCGTNIAKLLKDNYVPAAQIKIQLEKLLTISESFNAKAIQYKGGSLKSISIYVGMYSYTANTFHITFL